jgi:hypothetical protein
MTRKNGPKIVIWISFLSLSNRTLGPTNISIPTKLISTAHAAAVRNTTCNFPIVVSNPLWSISDLGTGSQQAVFTNSLGTGWVVGLLAFQNQDNSIGLSALYDLDTKNNFLCHALILCSCILCTLYLYLCLVKIHLPFPRNKPYFPLHNNNT